MRIVIADYSGHPFQVQLSRELAGRGHAVLHLHFSEFQTPKGRLTVGPGDPATLRIEPISLGRPFAKHALVKRRNQEIEIGKRFATRIAGFEPDVVVGSNLPLDSLRVVARRSRSMKAAFVFWQQDIYSVAIERVLSERFGVVGKVAGRYYRALEKSVLRSSHAVVAVSDDFVPYLDERFAVARERITVVENWAPLDEITPRPKSNTWSCAQGLVTKEVVLYTGTLGWKHDPSQILAMAEAFRTRPNTVVVVASEGPKAKWLESQSKALKLPSLRVVGFQPYEAYPDVLGSADVLISILEPDAGHFSVPSKVLSYLCAGRPIVLLAPAQNLASRIVDSSQGGKAIAAGDTEGWVKAVRSYLDNPVMRQVACQAARSYAERTFGIQGIGNRFEEILTRVHQEVAEDHRQWKGLASQAAAAGR